MSSKFDSQDRFSSKGFILAAIGSAVGLGNMWKFPYITGKYGGAAFFLIFFICLVIVGLPILLAEMSIGRGGRGSAVRAFRNLAPLSRWWGSLGFLSVLGAFVINSFYCVVAGWTIYYAVASLAGWLFASTDYTQTFLSFAGGYGAVLTQFLTVVTIAAIIYKGVAGGIETFNKWAIPGLAVILVILLVRSLTLPGASQGVSFFLNPDFSKLTAQSALIALGHAFFSLSLGMGAMLTYGAYVDQRQSLGAATWAIGGGDLLYAFVAGLVIFPITFTFGIESTAGPGLVFMALPAAFKAMPLGFLFAFLFFTLLVFAALTSALSLLEVNVAYAIDRFNWSRSKATVILAIATFLVGVPASLSFGPWADYKIFGKTFFDLLDFVGSNIMLPISGLVVTLFTGWAWKEASREAGLTGFWNSLWIFLLRWVSPALVILIFLDALGLLKF